MIEEVLRRVARDLSALGGKWAVVGGMAVSARTEPRFTRDVDLAIAVRDDRQAEDLVRELRARGYVAFAAMQQEVAKRLATVRLESKGTDVIVDLLFASSGIEPEVVAAATQLELVAGLVVPVATSGHLIALKLLSRDDRSRPQDAADLRALLHDCPSAELDRARNAIDLIRSRGFHRDRDLVVELERALASQ